eukprot:tig00000711_g3372.t1
MAGGADIARRLLLLGVAAHALYAFSVIDIYFGSPVVRGVEPVDASALFAQAPAARLVLFSADGLRADKFFELETSNGAANASNAPYLRSIIEKRGAWGVSHARAPTESRPGHVAMIAGFYEDLSAVTKGWKHNPIEFDSLFNRSTLTFGFGSPDIVPMFSELTTHMEGKTYPPEAEDFGSQDASELDGWVFRELEGLLAAAAANATLDAALRRPGLVLFLHLLGLDTNGHAHGPHSGEYAANVRRVDAGVQRAEELLEGFFGGDGRTAYLFTSDHGMSDKGNHGDGEPANTECPLVVWGAGFAGPRPAPPAPAVPWGHARGPRWVRRPAADERQGARWGLAALERTDVDQADLAPLMAAVLGLATPCNSEGLLPGALLRAPAPYRALAGTHNARQLLAQFRTKEGAPRPAPPLFAPPLPTPARSPQARVGPLRVPPYGPLAEAGAAEERLTAAEARLAAGAAGAAEAAEAAAEEAAVAATPFRDARTDPASSRLYRAAGAGALALQAALSLRMAALGLSWRMHLYPAGALLLWVRAAARWPTLLRVHRTLCGRGGARAARAYAGPACRLLAVAAAMLALAASYTHRAVYSALLLAAGLLWPSRPSLAPGRLAWAAACALAALFPALPVDVGQRGALVHAGALLLASAAARDALRSGAALSALHALLVLAAAATVASSDAARAAKAGLPLPNQLAAWAIFASWLLVQVPGIDRVRLRGRWRGAEGKGAEGALEEARLGRLRAVLGGFAAPMVLLSVAYEALFYWAFCRLLLAWARAEIRAAREAAAGRPAAGPGGGGGHAHLRWDHLRLACFLLVLVNLGFFGTGNVASISSFELASTYRFLTVFAPFTMAALLVFKILVTLLAPAAALVAAEPLLHVRPMAAVLLALAASDGATVALLFAIREEGSWQEIGVSVTQFGIFNANIVSLLLLYALARALLGPAGPRHAPPHPAHKLV